MEEDPNRRPDRKRRRERGDLEEEAKNQQSSPNIPSMLAVNQSAASVDGIGAAQERGNPLLLNNPQLLQQQYASLLAQNAFLDAIRQNPIALGLAGQAYRNHQSTSIGHGYANLLQRQYANNPVATNILISQILATQSNPLGLMSQLGLAVTASSGTQSASMAQNFSSLPTQPGLHATGRAHHESNQSFPPASRALSQPTQASRVPSQPTQASANVPDPAPAPPPTNREPILMYLPTDDSKVSAYQCLARKQIEFHEAHEGELEASAQGRNRPIVLGQVGIRCKHCAHLLHRQKSRASGFYPSTLVGIYQAAQNITNTHLAKFCTAVPQRIRDELLRLQENKSGPGGGKRYWKESAESLGIYEDANGKILRFRPLERTKR